ncbi:hypothetical protein HK097_000254 [Rhizophlyctis rosea]|uniref:RNA helicase n=1 Tax=Rhizophlyctis rosea TaxID=64517 RepID=A0AAD5S706_9FUNG|nr:hypothetical protein HK097_000254 [Rhizophlyctis rosea]
MRRARGDITPFAEFLATIEDVKRPTNPKDLKNLYYQYRVVRPIANMSPGMAIDSLKRMGYIRLRWTGQNTPTVEYLPRLTNLAANANAAVLSPAQQSLLYDSRKDLEANKMDVRITPINTAIQTAFGIPESSDDIVVQMNSTKAVEVTLTIGNHSQTDQSLERAPYMVPNQSSIVLPQWQWALTLPPRRKVKMTFSVRPRFHGLIKTVLVFNFTQFVICRFIEIRVEDAAIVEDIKTLQPTTPFIRKKQPRVSEVLDPKNEVVPGVPPPRPDFLNRMKHILKQYSIPRSIAYGFSQGDFANVDPNESPFPVIPGFHLSSLAALYHLEELQWCFDIRNYDMKDAMLAQSNRYLALTVPGLAEKRPSVLYGDKVLVNVPGETKEWQGYVHAVRQEEVLLRFNPSFHNHIWLPNLRVNIRFTFNRTPLRRIHQALELSSSIDMQLAFPSEPPQPPRTLPTIGAGARDFNKEQVQAIQHIVLHSHGRLPYIIFGPPGTGKTKTLVESIIQVHKKALQEKRRIAILAFAPSNSAADQMVERLKDVFTSSEMLRFNAYKRAKEDVSTVVMPYTTWDDGKGCFELATLARVRKARIVVCTAIMAGVLYSMGVEKGHFTNFFMDEAGQATEPEFWVGLAGLIDTRNIRSQVILAGDPKQLGPIIRSRVAKAWGLDKSYLERITDLPVYSTTTSPSLSSTAATPQTDTATQSSSSFKHPHLITKLVANYRSHPAIIDLPNRLFYGGDLLARADQNMRESLCQWQELPKKGFPILFHHVEGKDEREGDSPSWFNADEAAFVKRYITKLRDARGFGVDERQIGVITPYRKQVMKIRRLLGTYSGVRVGSVEEFQGQERRIIIISTVRSTTDHLTHDQKHHLGFLQNPKRFNVAITRAKALLIVIGNARVLRSDESWEKFISYVRTNGGWVGPDIGNEGMEDLVRGVEGLTLQDGAVGVVTAEEDPEWSLVG